MTSVRAAALSAKECTMTQIPEDGIDRLHPDYDGPRHGPVVQVRVGNDDEAAPVVGCGLRIYGLPAEAAGDAALALKIARVFDDALGLEGASSGGEDGRFYGEVCDKLRDIFRPL